MHRLLKRQLKKLFGEEIPSIPELKEFIEVVRGSYTQFQDDYNQLERVLELSSLESFAELSKFKGAIDSASIVSITDVKGEILYANENFVRVSGYSLSELLGSDHKLINSGYHNKSFWKEMWQTIGKGDVWRAEVCNKRKDGTLYWVNSTVIPFLQDNGKPYQYISIRFDITERKHIEEEIKKLALVAEKTHNAVIITDKHGIATWANKGFERIAEYRVEDLIGKNPGLLLQGKDTDAITKKEISDALRNLKPYNGDILNYSKSGRPYWIALNITPLIENDHHLGFIAIETDVTERKLAENQIRDNERILYALNLVSSELLINKNLEEAITKSLGNLGHVIGANHVFIYDWQYNDGTNKEYLSEKYIWKKDKNQSFTNRQEYQFLNPHDSGFEPWLKLLKGGQLVKVNLNDWPAKIGKGIQKEGYVSLMLAPIHIQEEFYGIIGLNSSKNEKKWSNSEEQFLLNLANTLGAAFERNFAEKKLKDNEEKFRLLIESATDIFYYTDALGNFTYVNDISTKITGFSHEELLNMNYLDLVIPEFKKQVRSFYSLQTFRGHRVTYNEFPILTKSGNLIWIGQNVQLIIKDGKIDGIQAIARDITAVKNAQFDLEQSRNFLNAIIDSIPNPLFVKNREHKWIVVNDAYAQLTGIPKEKILGFTDTDFIEDKEASNFISRDEAQFIAQDERVYEGAFEGPDQQIKNLFIKKNLFQNQGQEFLVSVITDISEIKKREAEILLYNKITDQLSDAISVADMNGNLVYVNQSHANAVGKTKEELIGMHISKMEKIFEREDSWETHLNEVREKNGLLVEGENIRKDGSTFPVEANVNLIQVDGRELLVATIRDISERKNIETEIRHKSQILNAIITNLPAVLYRVNSKGNIEELLGSGLKKLHMHDNELVGLHYKTAYPKELFPETNTYIEEILQTLKPAHFISQHNMPFGLFYFENFLFADETMKGNIIGLAFDITERREAEESLARSENRFRSLVQNASDVITVLSPEGDLVYESPSFYRIFGYEEDEIKGFRIFDLVHHDDLEIALREFGRGLEKGGVSSPVQMRIRHKNGSYVAIESVGNNLIDEPGIRGIVVNSRDITERLRAESENNRLREFFENILNKIPSDVVVFDRDHRYLFINEIAISDPQKRKWLLGHDDYEYCEKYDLPVRIADARRELFNKVKESKEMFEFEEKLKKQDGEFWVLRRMYPLVNEFKDVEYIIGFGLDITQRVKSQERVKESEERLSLAVNSANLGIWDWKISEDKLIWESSMYTLFDIDPEAFSGDFEAFDKTLHPEDKDAVNEEINRVLAEGGDFRMEFRILNRVGKTKYIAAYSKIFREDDGTPYRMIGVNFDITDSKLAEERILKQQHDLEEAQHIAHVGGWEIQLSDRSMKWSKEMFAICDKPSTFEPTIAETFQLFTPETSKAVSDAFFNVIEKFESFDLEACIVRDHRAMLDVRVKGVPVLEGNRVTMIKGIFQDITTEKAAQRQLEVYTKELEKKNQELDQFAYVVSHDLKAPLRGINNLSMWIEEDLEGKLEGDTKTNIDMMRKRVKRMENLIDGILQYSRAGRLKYDAVAFNLTDAIEDLVESLSPAEKFKITIPQDMPNLFTEKIAIEQVFTNYISNAIKYNNNPEPVIEVSWSIKNNFYEFCVSDNGPGIEKEFHEKVFVIFQTLQSRDTYESTGVGLAIVKKIVEDKGGQVWIESEKGKGSKFCFSWPIQEQTSTQ